MTLQAQVTGPLPAIEVGGTHVSVGLVDAGERRVLSSVRTALDPHARAESIAATIAAATAELVVQPGQVWGVAMPGPFDYDGGIGRYVDVGKFDALNDYDLGAALLARMPSRPSALWFVNDADAFLLGAQHLPAEGLRQVGITLGTGLGSGYSIDGRLVHSGPGVPPDGRANGFLVNGSAFEDSFSSRAIRRDYTAATGGREADVVDIADRARSGDLVARRVLSTAATALGRGFGISFRDFGADRVFIGGSIAGSWDLLVPDFEREVAAAGTASVRISVVPPEADVGLIGAAVALRTGARSPAG